MKRRIIVRIFLYAAFSICGYLVSVLIHFSHQSPPPQIVQDNRFVYLSSSVERNKYLTEFYLAWKNKEDFYGLEQIIQGFEGGVRAYWITQKGKLTLILEDIHGWRPVWITKNLKSISIGYDDKDRNFIEIDPEKTKYEDLRLTAKQ